MRTLALVLAFALAPLALAGETRTVTLPTGKTLEAEVIANPDPASLEGALLDAMKLVEAGSFDAYVAKYCHPSMCPEPGAIESVKRLNLTASQKTVGKCHEGDTLVITRRRGDLEKDGEITLYAWCGEGRMPAPATLTKAGDGFQITSFSW